MDSCDTSPTNDTTNDERTASLLFRTIAIKVCEAEELDLASVTAIQINPESKIGKLLMNVRNLFQENQETIPIIGNKALNTVLTSMANVMALYINNADKEVALSIYDTLLKKKKENKPSEHLFAKKISMAKINTFALTFFDCQANDFLVNSTFM